VARFGFKRTYLTFWGARKLVTAGLLLTPWVLSRFGLAAAGTYVAVITAGFAICRALGETGSYPWMQEYVPATVRGKYSATENLVVSVVNLTSVGIAGYALNATAGLTGYMALIAAGVVFGALSVWASAHLPGGGPAPQAAEGASLAGSLARAFGNHDFRLYLFGAGLVTLALGPVGGFLPLFMSEQVGLTSSQVVWLQTGSMLGGLLTSFGWGWAADRYGGRPVMLASLAAIAGLPLLWMVMPRHSPLAFAAALGIALLQGLLGMGWGIGATRTLFVGLVPPAHKTEFMAVHYAWMGAVGGLSQLVGGQILDYTSGISGRFLVFTIDPYTVLFVGAVVLPVIGGLLLRGIQSDSRVSTGEFAGLFLHGNPVLAAGSLIRYNLARDEQATVSVTEQLGHARSPLTVDELIETLSDPRFNVRFEAILALARMPADARVIAALGDLVTGSDPAMAVVAAWALGRIGDERARPFLRASLEAQYRSVQAHSVRALGTLQDEHMAPTLLERFQAETDHGLRMAYASALGKLRVQAATKPILDFLHETHGKNSRQELALAVARLMSDEPQYVRLWRSTRTEAGTALSQAVDGLKRRLARSLNGADAEAVGSLEAVADAFARDALDRGADLLGDMIGKVLPDAGFAAQQQAVLCECTARLKEYKAARLEYVLMALVALGHSAE
jgi:MFS family permease